jgi:hypothetical protein
MNGNQLIKELLKPYSKKPECIAIEKYFAGASSLNEENKFLDKKDWESKRIKNGIKNFKRKVLGLYGRKTIKSLDELTEILVDMNICNSNNAKQFIKKLYKCDSDNSMYYGEFSSIYFKKVMNKKGKEYCKISKISDSFSGGIGLY